MDLNQGLRLNVSMFLKRIFVKSKDLTGQVSDSADRVPSDKDI